MLIPDFSIFPFADSSKNRTFGKNAKIHDSFYQLKYFVTLVKRLCLRCFECSWEKYGEKARGKKRGGKARPV